MRLCELKSRPVLSWVNKILKIILKYSEMIWRWNSSGNYIEYLNL